MTPSLAPGQKVQYAEDGVLSMIYGTVRSAVFNPHQDRFEYLVDWRNQPDNYLYPKYNLNPITEFPWEAWKRQQGC
jgi:hypothetical protein